MKYVRKENRIVLRVDKGDELFSSIEKISLKENIKFASITGIGATDDFTISVFDINSKKYIETNHKGYFEITSIMGNLSRKDGKPYIHLHATCADANGKIYGGHLALAYICATAEITIGIIDVEIDRKKDDNIGLNLLEF